MINYRLIPKIFHLENKLNTILKIKLVFLFVHNVCFKEFTIETFEKNKPIIYSIAKPNEWKNSYLNKKNINHLLRNLSNIPLNFMEMNDKFLHNGNIKCYA